MLLAREVSEVRQLEICHAASRVLSELSAKLCVSGGVATEEAEPDAELVVSFCVLWVEGDGVSPSL